MGGNGLAGGLRGEPASEVLAESPVPREVENLAVLILLVEHLDLIVARRSAEGDRAVEFLTSHSLLQEMDAVTLRVDVVFSQPLHGAAAQAHVGHQTPHWWVSSDSCALSQTRFAFRSV